MLHRLMAAEFAPEALEFFERKIRPVLAEHCYNCHSAQAEKVKGGLLLDSRETFLQGGDTGPAFVPGDPDHSLFIKAIRYTDPELQMPPKNKKLSERQIVDLTRWVEMGAPWPAEPPPKSGQAKRGPFAITDQDRAWWAFQPIRRPDLPSVQNKFGIANGIDAFVLAGLEQKGLQPNPPATKRELLRRVYFDLIGLPPTSEAVAAFEKDKSPSSFERVIDQLLASPHYGERWGRHWLDVVRYAQSNGYERDGEKPLAWRYRDYVIKAFNEDKPYDRFILEQLAGDELPDVTLDSIIATGFQRLGVWDDEPDDKRMAEFDELDDIISTTGQTFLGLTLSCARCHDHKFDPISQVDYYQFLAFFRNIRLYENARYTFDSPNYVPLASAAEIKAWRTNKEERARQLKQKIEGETNIEAKKSLETQLKKVEEEKPPFDWALAVKERGRTPPPTHILVRGNAGTPGGEVGPAFLTVLGGERPQLPEPLPGMNTTGRRLALAHWIASPANPLTARVLVNRVWHHHFGHGLVRTTTDFGRAGVTPTHPELLDWLAAEFIRGGWSIKKLHKLILLSNSYQMSSRTTAAGAEIDPANQWLWRQNLRRLEAESMRDAVLAVCGRLNPAMGGRGFFPRLAGEALAGQSRPGLDWQICTPAELSRRSVYAFIRRTMLVPMFEAFDYVNTATPLGERPTTTVAPQALMLLNEQFMHDAASALASRVLEGSGSSTAERIRTAYARVLAREPTRKELRVAGDFVRRQKEAFDALRSRVTFRPDVPVSLSVEYMKQLRPDDFLTGPSAGWDFYRGHWSAPYEGIRTMDRQRGPFALWQSAPFQDGSIEGAIMLHTAAELGAIVFRAAADKDELRGYELVMDPRHQQVSLWRHAPGPELLITKPAAVPVGKLIPFKMEFSGAEISLKWNGDATPALEFADAHSGIVAGRAGVRAWGAAISFDRLVIGANGHRIECHAALERKVSSNGQARRSNSDADRQALASLCLLLLNLNEFVYID
ncbi:MAG: PSD1 and planctomycete cytochrome C domain-containing protein [Verrucomicrobiota bacterium]